MFAGVTFDQTIVGSNPGRSGCYIK